MMRCPLPIDWLEHLEGVRSEELAAHLLECRACQVLVEELGRERRPQLHLSRVPNVDSWPHWREAEAPLAGFGEIWWTADSIGSAHALVPRVPVLVISDVWQEAGRSWCEVVPLSADTENATSLDLILRRTDTDLEVPWRALLRYQTVVEMRELDSRIGRLTDAGQGVVHAVLAGNGPEERFGSPIEGPDDPRVRIPEDFADSVRLLGKRYARLLEQDKNARSSGRILSFEMRRSSITPGVPSRTLSLAAASEAEHENRPWIVEIPERGRIQGRLEHRYSDDELLFVIEDVAEDQLGLRTTAWIAAWSGQLDAPVTSQSFHPTDDRTVVIARDLGIFPREIDRLELRLYDEA